MASLRFASILSSNYYKSLENSLAGEFLMRDNFNVMHGPDGQCRLLPSPPSASLPTLLLLPSFLCPLSPPNPIPYLPPASVHPHPWKCPGISAPAGLSSPAQCPPCPLSVLLRELLHGIHFFPHLLRSVADGWSRRSPHEEPAHLLPVESTHPVNPRADLCCVSRSWDFQPLKFREEGKPLSAGSS